MSSYIQLDLDAINKFPLVARASGLPVETIYRGMVDMWTGCYRAKTDRLRQAELKGLFGPCEPLVDALELYGFVERLSEGMLRIRGTKRYTVIHEQRKRAGKLGGQKTAETRASKQNEAKPVFGGVLLEQNEAKPVFGGVCLSKTPEKARSVEQKQALYPRSDISPYGREISEIEDNQRSPSRSRQAVPPPDGVRPARPPERSGRAPAAPAKPPPPTPTPPPPPTPPVEPLLEHLPAGWEAAPWGYRSPNGGRQGASSPVPLPADWSLGDDGSLLSPLSPDPAHESHQHRKAYYRECGWI